LEREFLSELIRRGESQTTEFKIAAPRLPELAERICGLANGQGGYLVIGVEDGTWRVEGVKNPAQAIDLLLKAARSCKPILKFEPATPEVVELEGKALIVATISPYRGQLFQAGGIFWIRRGTYTIPLDLHEIGEYLGSAGALDWETRPADLASLDDLDLELVQSFLSQRVGRRTRESRIIDIESFLLKSRCVALVEGALRPTHAGLLLFGKEPQEFLPQTEVVCVLYPDTLGLERYQDRQNLKGALAHQIDQAEQFFLRNTRQAAIIEGFHRKDRFEYPMEALREAVVNAVVHRDYSLKSEKVRVFYYPDHIEIHSPGLLMPGITLEDLQQGRERSKPRNPLLANLLSEFPGGYMEYLGTGISFMINSMRQQGSPAPEFKLQNEFIVTFRKAIAATPKETEAHTIPKENLTLEERLKKALEYVHAHGSITNREYRKLTGVSEATALRDFEILVAQGSLKIEGSKKGRRYTLN